jgi:hypothetical protein
VVRGPQFENAGIERGKDGNLNLKFKFTELSLRAITWPLKDGAQAALLKGPVRTAL